MFAGDNVAVLFLYCRHEMQQNMSIDLTTMLKVLLRQLVVRSIRSPYVLAVWNEKCPLDLKVLEQAIQAETATYDKVFVIVDALDELSPSLRQDLLDSLRSPHISLRLLFTSRPTIADLFRVKGHVKVQILADEADLCLYVTSRLNKAAKAQPALRDAVKTQTSEMIVKKIIDKAARL